MLRRASRYLDKRPLRAVLLGLFVVFLILYFAEPQLLAGVDQPVFHSRGAV